MPKRRILRRRASGALEISPRLQVLPDRDEEQVARQAGNLHDDEPVRQGGRRRVLSEREQ